MSARASSMPRRLLAGLVGSLLAAGVLGLAAPGTALADSAPANAADPATPPTVTADALPTVQMNGVAWSQVIVGNTVYVAGAFTSARPAGAPAGTQETPRANLLAYDVRTGVLVQSFAPVLNAQALVVSASPDGSRIYVGGDFTQVNGQVRNRVAAFDTATGALVADFRPSVSGQVRAIAATNSTVYLGGVLTAVGSVSRTRLAAVSATNGALLPWAPVPGVGPTTGNRLPNNPTRNAQTSNEVMALVLTGGGSQVVAGGRFHTMNGAVATGVAALDPVTGANRPFAVNQMITNQGINSAVYSLSTDGATVYGSGYDYYGPGNLEGVFAADATGGALQWVADCRGDTYSTAPSGGAVYVASHEHNCENIGAFHDRSPQVWKFGTALGRTATHRTGPYTIANSTFANKPAPTMLDWFPTFSSGTYTGAYQAGWTVTGNGQYVVYGGEFPRVNGTNQQGLVRFAVPSIAPGKVGPTAQAAPTAVSVAPGNVRVGWRASTDLDNENLTYRVYRDGGATPVHQATLPSRWYDAPLYAWTDTGVAAGSHSYRVSVTDPSGNTVQSPATTVTVAAGTTPTRGYSATVLADAPASYWPMDETSGTTAHDRAGGNDLTVGAGVTRGSGGAVTGDPATAYSFDGTTTGLAATQNVVTGANTVSLEAWFQTTSRTGGKIVGFGDKATGTSSNYDRHVYLDASGKVNFGVYQGGQRVVTSPLAYNDGRWHHVVATLGPQGMALYVDGRLLGSRTDTFMGQPFDGYWRVGGDTSWSGAAFLTGRIDEVAVYRTALSAAQVSAHHAAGTTGRAANIAPMATFGSTVTQLDVAFDASPSRDADGTVAGYAWDFGDGTTGTGRTATHRYAASGTFPVTLTVTDDQGATGRSTQSVTVLAPPPNVAPVARFVSAVSGSDAAFDASTSTDSDGTVAGYAWDFGDGTTGTGRTPTHAYAQDGTYTVRLAVTDDDGATHAVQGTVTISSAVIAADAFGRQVTSGWGTADTGGTWTVGGAATASVADGTGTMVSAPGRSTSALLGAVSAADTTAQVDVVLPATTTGGGTYLSLATRRVGTSDYRVKLWFRSTGDLQVSLVRMVGNAETTLAATSLPGGYAPGQELRVRFEAAGSGTTTLRGKVWAPGATEPGAWTVTATDGTAALQQAGALYLYQYSSGSATAPATLRYDDLWVGVAGAAPGPQPQPEPEQPVNAAPVAAFTQSVTDLAVSVDGTSSRDSDGTVAGYAWDFGDGQSGTGATASHTYATPGTYTVRLTVTDDDAATARAEQPVTVTAPAGPQEPQDPASPAAFATDTFTRTVTGGLGTADLGGAWTPSFGGSRMSVAGGVATLGLSAPGNNTGAFLGDVDQASSDLRTSVALAQAPTGGGVYVYLRGRVVDTYQEYRARLRFTATGAVALGITKQTGTAADALIGPEVVVPGLTYTPGTVLDVRFQVSGSGTTQLALSVWAHGATEPATPTVTRTDTTASLQATGGVGISAYLTGSATAANAVRVSAFSATPVVAG
ncbi:PKD domain-containing protein [Blastococcus sp. SYSU D00695]